MWLSQVFPARILEILANLSRTVEMISLESLELPDISQIDRSNGLTCTGCGSCGFESFRKTASYMVGCNKMHTGNRTRLGAWSQSTYLSACLIDKIRKKFLLFPSGEFASKNGSLCTTAGTVESTSRLLFASPPP